MYGDCRLMRSSNSPIVIVTSSIFASGALSSSALCGGALGAVLPGPPARSWAASSRFWQLTIDIPGFIPDDYVPDPGQRLELYKRLSAIEDDDELRTVMAEISDRYGPLPGDVVLLGEVMGQKALARRMGALALEITASRVAIALPDGSAMGAAALAAGWRRLPDGRYAMALKAGGAARQALLAVLARATDKG